MIKIKTSVRAGIALVVTAGLAGCAAHLNQQQCSSMDWYQVGFNDALQGKFQRDLNNAINDCAKFNISIKTTDYNKGWKNGARQFCQPGNAYKLGASGAAYNNICPSDLSQSFAEAWHSGLRKYCIPTTGYNLGRSGAAFPDFCASDQLNRFRNAYDDGRRVFDTIKDVDGQIDSVSRQIDDLNYQITNRQRKMDKINQMLRSNTSEAGTPLTPQQRSELYSQMRDFNGASMQMRDQIRRLESQRNRLQQQKNDIRIQS